MLRILWNGKSALAANQEKLEAISNNLANVDTVGYKKVNVNFKDLVYETLDRQGYPVTENSERGQAPFTGTGVKASTWTRTQAQGNLKETNLSTDIAVDGGGFFSFTKPDGTQVYSRAGGLSIDEYGRIVDSNGNMLNIDYNQGFSGENVKFTKDNFKISQNGNILLNNNNNEQVIGQIPLYDAIGMNSFVSVGENMYAPTAGANIERVNNSSIMQGYLENSNVDITTEMTDMIITQRAFELGSRSLKTADEMWGMANNLKSR